jgi:hypothetical protein
MPQDIHLLYSGGSGGFFCLHLLLLTGKYNCKFNCDTQDYQTIFKNHWNINSDHWKKSEIWPLNSNTFESNLTNKLYYTCNPKGDALTRFNGTTIVLYTDIETQWFLAKTKHALWFTKDETFKEQRLCSLKEHQRNQFILLYYQVKAPDWPLCNSIEEFFNLPEVIQHECIDQFNFNDVLDIDKFLIQFKESGSITYNGEKITRLLKTDIDIDEADIRIKLHDLIKTKGEVLFEQLGIHGNEKTRDFVDMYIQLHTPEQQQYLLKK